MSLAGHFGVSQAFPGQAGIWEMTAAQRALLLGPLDEDRKSGRRRGPARRLTMEEMEKMSAKAEERRKKRKQDATAAIAG